MKIRSAIAVAVAVAGLSACTAVYGSPATNVQSPAHAMFAKGKTVKFAVRNDSGSQMELKVGDQVMAIAAGKTVSLTLAVGTRILVNAATPTHHAGELLAEASTALEHTTLTIK